MLGAVASLCIICVTYTFHVVASQPVSRQSTELWNRNFVVLLLCRRLSSSFCCCWIDTFSLGPTTPTAGVWFKCETISDCCAARANYGTDGTWLIRPLGESRFGFDSLSRWDFNFSREIRATLANGFAADEAMSATINRDAKKIALKIGRNSSSRSISAAICPPVWCHRMTGLVTIAENSARRHFGMTRAWDP